MAEDIFYKQIMDHLHSAVLLVDEHLLIQYLNPAAEALLAVGRARALGQPFVEHFKEYIDHQRVNTTARLQQCLTQSHPFTQREARLWVIEREMVVDYTIAPMLHPDQPTTLLIEIQSMDRMARISREESLIANHHATRALIRGMAHEIKNPLGGIRGAAQLLAKTTAGTELADYTHIIIEETDRLRNLADRMLGPRKLPVRQQINIHECLERVVALIGVEANGRVDIKRDYDPSLPDIQADPDQLIQAILNITGNALQALLENPDQQNPCITIRSRHLRQFTIGATRHRLVIRVDIIDNGPGIPPALLETIFYPMVSGRANGSGLGLSIAQDIVHQYHGLIECESHKGQTIFTLLLPIES